MSKPHSKTTDKQLEKIEIVQLAKKRELDQAFNMKEFAVLADISYSMTRYWFRLPGFPGINGLVFWPDFIVWRQSHSGLTRYLEKARQEAAKPLFDPEDRSHSRPKFTGRLAKIMAEAGPEIKFTGKAAQLLKECGG